MTSYGRTFSVASILAAGAMLTAFTASEAWSADGYPTRPIRILVGFSAGGANDLVARAVGTRLGPRVRQQVIVENRPGAGGNIATELASGAAPDGYTMLLASVASFAMSPALLGKVPFDPLNDFSPVTQAAIVTSLLSVHPTVPAQSVKQFVALAKQQPGRLNYATPGTGSIAHLASALFMLTAGIQLNHIPYKGGSPAVRDTIAGQVDGIFSLISTQVPLVRAGRLRGLGVTSAKRVAALPQIPTIAESGYPGFEASGWLGFVFPAKTPQAIVDRMQHEIVAVLNMAEVRSQLENVGLDPEPTNPASFSALINADHARWAKVVKDAGLRMK